MDFVLWGLENQAKIHYAMPLRHMVGDAFSYMKEYDEIAAVNKKNGDFHSADEFLSGFKKTDRLHPVISLCVYYGESEWDGPFSLKDMLEIPEKIESQKLIDHALELEQKGGQINMCNALEELRQEGVEEGRQEGRWEGILEGIRATVRTCRNFNISEADTVRNIMNEFSLSQEEAVNYVKKYCIEQIRKMSVVSPEVLQYGIRFELIFFRRIQHLPLIYFCYQYSIIITLFPRKEL